MSMLMIYIFINLAAVALLLRFLFVIFLPNKQHSRELQGQLSERMEQIPVPDSNTARCFSQ